MDELDLELNELASQFQVNNKTIMDPVKIKSGRTNTSRYVDLAKRYFFYWSSAIVLFLFILWASPDYCYVDYSSNRQGASSKQFVWSRFFTVWITMYLVLLSIHVSSNFLAKSV